MDWLEQAFLKTPAAETTYVSRKQKTQEKASILPIFLIELIFFHWVPLFTYAILISKYFKIIHISAIFFTTSIEFSIENTWKLKGEK